jgi:RNA polymerase sigma-70 factor, ECF subfamily
LEKPHLNLTRISLLQRIASQSDSDGWNEFDLIYRPFIAAQIRDFRGLHSLADDVVQNVMIIVHDEIGRFQRQRDGSFRRWLRNVTMNQIRNALRQERRKPKSMEDVELLVEQRLGEWSDPASIASKRWDAQHDQRIYEHAISVVRSQVESVTWNCFDQYVLKDQEPGVVAKRLDVPTHTVYLAKSRITRRLREEISRIVGEED